MTHAILSRSGRALSRMAVVALLLLTSGCATQEDYLRSLQAYNGQPERALLDTFGVPDRTYEADGRTYLSFVTRREAYYPPETGLYGTVGRNRSVFGTRVGTGGAYGGAYQVSECENIFVIHRGLVERSGFKGHCY